MIGQNRATKIVTRIGPQETVFATAFEINAYFDLQWYHSRWLDYYIFRVPPTVQDNK